MSATVAGAIKALVEAAGLGVAAYRDVAPPGATLPYVLIREGIAVTTEPSGDFGAPGPYEVREEVQVDVVQAWKNPQTGARLEVYGLADAVAGALRGAAPQPVLDGHVYPARVIGRTRIPPAAGDQATTTRPAVAAGDENILRDVLTVEVLRVVTPTVAAP